MNHNPVFQKFYVSKSANSTVKSSLTSSSTLSKPISQSFTGTFHRKTSNPRDSLINLFEPMEAARPILRRQNNISEIPKVTHSLIGVNSKPANDISRIKLHYKTIKSISKIPKGRILYTDFWSENMKVELVKMGRIDALESYNGIMPIEKPVFKKEIEISLAINEFSRKNLLSRASFHNNSKRKTKRIKHKSMDISHIVDICNESRTQNQLLKDSMNKTTVLLKRQFNSILKQSSSKH